jgi:hypothetical protein
MTRIRTLAAGVVVALCTLAAGAGAIGNGVPDGNAHPNVGLLAIGVEEDGQLVRFFTFCSGSYGGPRVGQPAEKVFVTAGHCVNWLPDEGIPADQLWVTFDAEATFDAETGAVTGASSWHQASGIGFDPALGDYGVVLLESVPVGLAPVELPTASLLDDLTAQGGLRPKTVFDNVGYGAIPTFKQGPPQLTPPPGRMFSTSRYKGLTKKFLKLNMNSELDGNGGVCFGDSGSPKLIHGTNTAVAITTGGDPNCRSNNYNSRLGIAAARSFYGQYLVLP